MCYDHTVCIFWWHLERQMHELNVVHTDFLGKICSCRKQCELPQQVKAVALLYMQAIYCIIFIAIVFQHSLLQYMTLGMISWYITTTVYTRTLYVHLIVVRTTARQFDKGTIFLARTKIRALDLSATLLLSVHHHLGLPP